MLRSLLFLEDPRNNHIPCGHEFFDFGHGHPCSQAHRPNCALPCCQPAAPASPAPSVATEAYSEELEEEEEPPIDGANAPSLVMSALEWSTGTYSSSE